MSETTTVRDSVLAMKTAFARANSRFGDTERDTQPHMTTAAVQMSEALKAQFDVFSPEQQIAMLTTLTMLQSNVRTVGHKRIFGVALPRFAASLLAGPPEAEA